MNETKINILPDEIFKKVHCLDEIIKNNNFILKTAILKKGKIFYQYFADYDKTINFPTGKPTKPAKQKASICFHKTKSELMRLADIEIVAMRIFNKKHGEFLNFSYENCPIDVIEYLISKRN